MKKNFGSKGRLSVFILLIFLSTGCRKDFKELVEEVNPPIVREDKPNVILINIDDFGYELPNYTGGESYSTPNLNFIASNGMQFSQAFCHPDGWPSRLAIFTGKYSFRNYDRWGLIPYGQNTIGNMMQGAGYKTAYYGKWQGDGGDTGINRNGFQKYAVFLPFGEDQRVRRYKNPFVYTNGAYLSDAKVEGKYSEDIFCDSLFEFIDENKNNPFFAYYSPNLVAKPWVPTPDDPEFPRWKPEKDQKKDEIRYFTSMVAYVDKKIGQIMDKLRKTGLDRSTIIIICADNNTDSDVYSAFNGRLLYGAKTSTVYRGTHIPFLVYWPGTVQAGVNNTSLVDYTDILPTLADIAGISYPTTYGTLDGTTFYDNMKGVAGLNREWVFCHWDNDLDDGGSVAPERFVYNDIYKLYDSVGNGNGRFFNMLDDPDELRGKNVATLTTEEAALREEFLEVLKNLK